MRKCRAPCHTTTTTTTSTSTSESGSAIFTALERWPAAVRVLSNDATATATATGANNDRFADGRRMFPMLPGHLF